jgi:hypothetical protein
VNDPHVLDPSHAPTPFTADEIRRNSPAGKTIELVVEAEGTPPFRRVNRYLEADAQGARIERRRIGSDEPPQTARSTWLELQEHASFPADRTTIVTETIDTPLGRLDCLRYTVRGDDGSVRTFWFATDLPGMPVRSEVRAADGVTTTTTMVANSVAAPTDS